MHWLEKNINSFFKFNGVLLILTIMIAIWAALLLGIPHGSSSSWKHFQWKVAFNFIWEPTLIDSVICLLLAFFCFMKKHLVFPILLLYSIFSLNQYINSLSNIIETEYHRFFGSPVFLYPPVAFEVNSFITSLIFFTLFVCSILGTTLWIRKLRKR